MSAVAAERGTSQVRFSRLLAYQPEELVGLHMALNNESRLTKEEVETWT